MGSTERVCQTCSQGAEWFRNRCELIRTRLGEDEGASLVEYALLIALIAVVCISALTFFGRSVSSKFSQQGSCVQAAGNPGPMTGCNT